jgi:hypothetical protein
VEFPRGRLVCFLFLADEAALATARFLPSGGDPLLLNPFDHGYRRLWALKVEARLDLPITIFRAFGKTGGPFLFASPPLLSLSKTVKKSSSPTRD